MQVTKKKLLLLLRNIFGSSHFCMYARTCVLIPHILLALWGWLIFYSEVENVIRILPRYPTAVMFEFVVWNAFEWLKSHFAICRKISRARIKHFSDSHAAPGQNMPQSFSRVCALKHSAQYRASPFPLNCDVIHFEYSLFIVHSYQMRLSRLIVTLIDMKIEQKVQGFICILLDISEGM